MSTVALSLGTATGYAIAIGDTLSSGFWSRMPGGCGGVKLLTALDKIHAARPVTRLIYEDTTTEGAAAVRAVAEDWARTRRPAVAIEVLPARTSSQEDIGAMAAAQAVLAHVCPQAAIRPLPNGRPAAGVAIGIEGMIALAALAPAAREAKMAAMLDAGMVAA